MDVHLLVYDLSNGLAKQLSFSLLGFQLDAIYHTSIELEGMEYVYDSGINVIKPGTSHLGSPLERIHLGKSELPMEIIVEYLESLKEIYTPQAYDLFRHNCNNFSNDFSTFLVGKGIPDHIANMPQDVLDSPFGRMMQPQLAQMVEQRKAQQGGLLGIQNNVQPHTNGAASTSSYQDKSGHTGSVKVVTSLSELNQVLDSSRKTGAIVFFTMANCGPCRVLYPLYDNLAQEYQNKVTLIKVDIHQAFDVSSKYNITSTPTFITFLHGKEEDRFTGADAAKLRGTVSLLAQMASPSHPHQFLRLNHSTWLESKPVIYEKVIPIPKLLSKLGSKADDDSIQGMIRFIETKTSQGPALAHLPDLSAFSNFMCSAVKDLPKEILFPVVDLFRCALADARVSGYFAEEHDHKTVLAIVDAVNKDTECPYALRLMTLQMASNLFSSHLYVDQILGNSRLRSAITQLISSSFLDDKHSTVRVAATSLLFNVASANLKKRFESGDVLPEDDQVELAASLLEAISQEEASKEALDGMLLALGLMTYCLPLEGELIDLLRSMDAQGTVLAKEKLFKTDLTRDVGQVSIVYGLSTHDHLLRFRDTIANICKILYTGMNGKLDPRIMPSPDMMLRVLPSSASTPSLRSRDGTLPPHMRMDSGGNVRVVVRVRAFLPREIERGAECLISMDPITQQTILHVPNDNDPANSRAKSRKVIEEKDFTFDNSFWSHDLEDEHYAHQEDVYNSLGEEFLDHNFEGYHTCIFAYGQTGSGKSYTMMGTPDQPGLIPRTCEDLFQRIEAAQNETPNISYHVRASYFEVYNEHVRDLLVPVVPNQAPYYLKIRESPTDGPYVKDLTEVPVRGLNEILRYMKAGDASRTTASTKMNDTSSRSHAVFTIMLKQIHHDMGTDETTERSSRIRLVDLAGSERAKSTEATGARLREGSNINKSLTTLGRVIAALADPKSSRGGGGKQQRSRDIVPYRDSILTWLLKDSLGGNSKTAMIACISPSDYEETLSTLRYADQAKRIRTRAVVNQNEISAAQRDAQISAMAEEIRLLQLSVSETRHREKEDARQSEERLEEYQNRVVAMQRMMEEKSLVAEGKIRSLQTENEALKLHLKLALDSLKNPIPEVVVREDEVEGEGVKEGKGGRRESAGLVDEAYYDQDDGYESDIYEEKANDVQDYMHDLLEDLALFRRKIGDDKGRWLDDGTRNPFGVRVNI
ncbi:P-loop containing nucleoside triphosphate hydrolase protein [Annulohypoxylon maeteangense]|uniref:P-loop containing nucleoside triphosphate hydrolase protein n=1 Tax=Annulohypoxylon maeteangense TaxID=1927788 RepID=UPI002007E43A|nr:P-loop containing nucleoside triphosphate hydrolase protein [Annulohypoxylon maeteangense]KAI0883253.1 P-loop containing nucleoside triphosphate hydrolase protein [Annulohypoxylon maeteangense]